MEKNKENKKRFVSNVRPAIDNKPQPLKVKAQAGTQARETKTRKGETG